MSASSNAMKEQMAKNMTAGRAKIPGLRTSGQNHHKVVIAHISVFILCKSYDAKGSYMQQARPRTTER